MTLKVISHKPLADGTIDVNFQISSPGMYRYVIDYCAYSFEDSGQWYKAVPVNKGNHSPEPLFVGGGGGSFTFKMKDPLDDTGFPNVDHGDMSTRITVADMYCVDAPTGVPDPMNPPPPTNTGIPGLPFPNPPKNPNPQPNPQPKPPAPPPPGDPPDPEPPDPGEPGDVDDPPPPEEDPGPERPPPTPEPPEGGAGDPEPPPEEDPDGTPTPGEEPTPGPEEDPGGTPTPPTGLPDEPEAEPGDVPTPGDGGTWESPHFPGTEEGDPLEPKTPGNTPGPRDPPIEYPPIHPGHIQAGGDTATSPYEGTASAFAPTPTRDIGISGYGLSHDETPTGIELTAYALPSSIYFEDDHFVASGSVANSTGGDLTVDLQLELINGEQIVSLGYMGQVTIPDGGVESISMPVPGQIFGEPGTYLVRVVLISSTGRPIGFATATVSIGDKSA